MLDIVQWIGIIFIIFYLVIVLTPIWILLYDIIHWVVRGDENV